MPVVGTRTDLMPLSRSGISPPGSRFGVSSTSRAVGALCPFPQGCAGAAARPSPAAVTRPPLRLYFVSLRAKTSEAAALQALGPPGGGGRLTGGATPSAAPPRGHFVQCRGPGTHGGRGGAQRARSARAAAAALAAGSRAGQEQMAALLLLYLPVLPGLAGAFNLDTDNVISWSGEKESLFGFSLAMHRQLQPQEKRL